MKDEIGFAIELDRLDACSYELCVSYCFKVLLYVYYMSAYGIPSSVSILSGVLRLSVSPTAQCSPGKRNKDGYQDIELCENKTNDSQYTHACIAG
jgi:hypothetical protein